MKEYLLSVECFILLLHSVISSLSLDIFSFFVSSKLISP